MYGIKNGSHGGRKRQYRKVSILNEASRHGCTAYHSTFVPAARERPLPHHTQSSLHTEKGCCHAIFGKTKTTIIHSQYIHPSILQEVTGHYTAWHKKLLRLNVKNSDRKPGAAF